MDKLTLLIITLIVSGVAFFLFTFSHCLLFGGALCYDENDNLVSCSPEKDRTCSIMYITGLALIFSGKIILINKKPKNKP